MEERGSPISGSPENTESGSPTPVSGGVISAPPEQLSGGFSTAVVALGITGSTDPNKKKRGRPRKYDINGNLNPAYVNRKKISTPENPVSHPPGFTLTTPFPTEYGMKKGRGKHSVPVNWHQPSPASASASPSVSASSPSLETAGSDFTVHVITVQRGEDVTAKIHSLGQKGSGPRGVCVLSATGVVSNVTIRQLGSSGGLLTYEGRFEILLLRGSYTINEANGVTTKTGGLSISLVGPDGRVVGGSVAGWITAANPIQVVIGTFVPYGYKPPKRKYQRESPTATAAIPVFPDTTPAEIPNMQTVPEVFPPEVPSMGTQSHSEADDSIGNGHNLNVISSHNASEWNNGSQPSQQQRFYADINVSVPGV
ncbi:unnamed protein product [Amaranthus hypochondriacus]